MVLDQLEQHMKRNPRKDHRTVSVHFAVSRPEPVARIRCLGAIVSGNPYDRVALADNARVHGLGAERTEAMVRMGDVERAGITNDGNVGGPEQGVSTRRAAGRDP